MKKYTLILLLIVAGLRTHAQCLTNSIVINTGYDPTTGLAITPGTNGGAPVTDPHWIVTAESAGTLTAISSAGLTAVTLGANADVIQRVGSWIADPPTSPGPGNWISCLNSNTYNTDGTGPSGTVYSMTFARSFRMCSADSITFNLNIANDNWIPSMDVDGTVIFTQPAIDNPANFTSFTPLTVTMYLGAGTHNINVMVNNYNDPGIESNPTGLEINGTLSSAHGFNSIINEAYPSCLVFPCSMVCNSVSVPDTIRLCQGDSATITATVTGTDSVLDYLWSPSAGLSATTGATVTVHAGTGSTYYYVTLESLLPFNFVANGDFSEGNVDFSSSYRDTTGPSSLFPESYYSVTTDPILVHPLAVSFHDHTTGTGDMMVINGAGTPISVWCETIPVTPNTTYDFSAWMANWSTADVGPGCPILQFMINGVLIGTPYTLTAPPGTWINFFSTWNSGPNTTATICIYDENTAASGNDFALDDISFKQICTSEDSVYVTTIIPDTTFQTNDTTLCITALPLVLNAPAGYTSYLWNTGATGTSIIAPATGTYWVQCVLGCNLLIDTFHVTYAPIPTVFIGNDTAFCVGDTITLSSPQPQGSSYLWNNGSTAGSVVADTTGLYWLQVSNGYCIAADSIHVIVSPYPVVNLGPDTLDCNGMPITLQSSGVYTAPTYLWNDGSAAPTLVATVTGTYWLQVTVAGCAKADTINVQVLFDTVHLYNNDTAICRGASVPVLLHANPLSTYQWRPTAGVPAYMTQDPVITPDTSAMYRVTVSLTGCPDVIDSFYIDVQPNPIAYAGGARSVCQYDTLDLRASATPDWYTHYSFTWEPDSNLNDTSGAVVVFTAGSSRDYIVHVTTPAGCSSMDSAYVTVYPGNFANILGGVLNLCPHDSAQFLPQGGVSYVWHPGMYLSDSTAAMPWVHAITSINYTIIATSANGCFDTLTQEVVVHPNAFIYLPDSVTIFPGQSYPFAPVTNCTYFSWFPPSGLSSANVSDPVASPQLSTTYVVTGKTDDGCETEDTVQVIIDLTNLIAVPNAFTPGEGPNSKLILIPRGTVQLNYFRIFNRWGNKVFETSNLNDGWDGTYHGTPQPYDVYVYEIEAQAGDGKVFKKSGNVTLIR